MKTKSEPDKVLSKIFGSISRARILELLCTNLGRSFYQREIMFEIGLSLQPVQRELINLSELGIIEKKETKNRAYYQINPKSPFFKPLRGMIGSISEA
jgi:predicted transcriptional regulator